MKKMQCILMIFIFSSMSVWAGNLVAEHKTKPRSNPKQSLRRASTKENSTVWIKRSDGALSCAMEKGQSLEEGAGELKNAHIQILDSRKSNDGQLHIQMCGAPTGSENAYLIQKVDLAKAIALGFREIGEKQKKQ